MTEMLLLGSQGWEKPLSSYELSKMNNQQMQPHEIQLLQHFLMKFRKEYKDRMDEETKEALVKISDWLIEIVMNMR